MTTTQHAISTLMFASIPAHAHPVTDRRQLRYNGFPKSMIKTLLERAGYTGDAVNVEKWQQVNLREDLTLEVAYVTNSPQAQETLHTEENQPDRFELVNALMSAENAADKTQPGTQEYQEYQDLKQAIQDALHQARKLAD